MTAIEKRCWALVSRWRTHALRLNWYYPTVLGDKVKECANELEAALKPRKKKRKG